jgi:hypothetical protein
VRIREKGFDLTKDLELWKVVRKIYSYYEARPKTIVMTGGSGQILDMMVKVINEQGIRTRPKVFVCDPSYQNVKALRRRFRESPWVKVHHSLSLFQSEAEILIKNDPMLQDESLDLYVDSHEPVDFYLKEIRGDLFGDKKKPGHGFLHDQLGKKFNRPFTFILDGVGAISWYEFQAVAQSLGREKFDVFVTNLDHIKGHRIIQYALNTPRYYVPVHREGQWARIKHYRLDGPMTRESQIMLPYDPSLEV